MMLTLSEAAEGFQRIGLLLSEAPHQSSKEKAETIAGLGFSVDKAQSKKGCDYCGTKKTAPKCVNCGAG